MKKTLKKLNLHRETLRLLNDGDLQLPAGGVTNPCPISYNNYTCNTGGAPTCACTTRC